MADPGTRIRNAFKQQKLSERSFKWLIDFLKKHQGEVELLEFSVYEDGTEAHAVISYQHGFLGTLAKEVADHSPVPFRFTVLSFADPNPGNGTVVIGWGGGK